MDLNDLAVFAAVGQTSGISAAAARLGVPKSTVSRSLARLEAELGVELVHRTTRKVSLSSAGAEFHARVSPLVLALEASVQELPEREAQPSGRLRLTLPGDFGATVLADVIVRFMARYPEVQVEVFVSNTFVDLVAEGFDAAIRISRSKLRDSSLVAQPVATVTVQLFASPQYLARRGTPRHPDDLGAHDWVSPRVIKSLELTAGDQTVAVAPRGRLACEDMFFARASVRAGAGIGQLPAFLAEPDVLSGHLVRVLPRWSVPSARVWLMYPSARNVPSKVVAFKNFVVEALGNRPLA
jgi:DNA-binding transcriptional LysR family regulator